MRTRCFAVCTLLLFMCGSFAVHANAPYGFYMNEYVKPVDELHVRAGAGTNYTSYGLVQPGNPGEIIGGPTYNNGYYWWKVDYPIQGLTGWCAQNWLEVWEERDEEDFADGYVEVDDGPVNTRSAADVEDGVILETYSNGDVGEVVGGPFHYQAYVWWRIKWPDNITGWTVQRYLVEASAPPEPDTDPPTISRNGSSTVEVAYGANYADAGATAWDDVDGDLTDEIVTTGLPVDTTDVGDHYVWYNVEDSAGNPAQAKARIVRVLEDDEPLPPPPPPEPEEGSAVIFGNALGDGWYDSSWNASHTANDGHLEVSFGALGELRFNTDSFNTSGHNLLSFWIYPNEMNEQLYVHLYDANESQLAHLYVPDYVMGYQLYPYIWQQVHIPLADLNADNTVVTGIGFQLDYAATILLDEIRFNLHTENGGECNEN